MRQLFVPACLCLMTLSNTTGFDLPLEKYSGMATVDKDVLDRRPKVLMREATAFADDECAQRFRQRRTTP